MNKPTALHIAFDKNTNSASPCRDAQFGRLYNLVSPNCPDSKFDNYTKYNNNI